MKTLSPMLYFVTTRLLVALVVQGSMSPCPSNYVVFEDVCFRLDRATGNRTEAEEICSHAYGSGVRLAEPKHRSEVDFLNFWLLDEDVKSVWVGATEDSEEPSILEPSREPTVLLRNGSASEQHMFVCQKDFAAFEQRNYIFPSLHEVPREDHAVYVEVMSSFRNLVVHVTFRYYQARTRVKEDFLQVSYHGTLVIQIEPQESAVDADVCEMETDAPVTAMLYRVSNRAVGGTLLLPIPQGLMMHIGRWVLYFISAYQGTYKVFMIGVKHGYEPVKVKLAIEGVGKREVSLPQFKASSFSIDMIRPTRVLMEATDVFNVFFILDRLVFDQTNLHLEQVLPSIVASRESIYLPVPVEDGTWKCKLDLYAESPASHTLINIETRGDPVILNEGNNAFHAMHYGENVHFKRVSSVTQTFQLTQYIKRGTGKVCRMDVLPVKMWTTRYAFNWRLIYQLSITSVDKVYIYIVHLPTSADVGILLNDDDVTPLFQCRHNVGNTYYGCMGSMEAITSMDSVNQTYHLSTNVTQLCFGAYLLIQTQYQFLCSPLGFLDEYPNWIEASLSRRTKTATPGNLDNDLTIPLQIEQVLMPQLDEPKLAFNRKFLDETTSYATIPTPRETGSHFGIAKYMENPPNPTTGTTESSNRSKSDKVLRTTTEFDFEWDLDLENDTLDSLARTSTETYQNTTFDDVDRTTSALFGNGTSTEDGYETPTTDPQRGDRERRCRCFTLSHPCLQTVSIPNITTEEKKQELVEEIKKELTIDAEQTSSAIRKRTSAQDKRQSSASLGLVGVAMISLLLALIIIPDAITLVSFFISCLF